MSKINPTTNFSSEGFDLDQLAAAIPNGDNDIVYELGGKISVDKTTTTATTTTTSTEEQPRNNDDNKTDDAKKNDTTHPLTISEQYKKDGNDLFLKHKWQEAYDLYTKAIEAVPYDNDVIYSGDKLLKLQQEWEKEQALAARKKLQERDERERLKRQPKYDKQNKNNNASNNNRTNDTSIDDNNDDDDTDKKDEPPQQFRPPHHPFAENLSVYHCNRAAALLQLEQQGVSPTSGNGGWKTNDKFEDDDDDDEYDEYGDKRKKKKKKNPQLQAAVRDCSIAILLKPDYMKALIRRATAYERSDQTDMALEDTKQAIRIMQSTGDLKSSQYKTAQATVTRLQKIEDERLEKLKTETLGKLKDLGNSILGNFGLSLDNFQATKDPNSGSYSISFNNGGK